jgi:hypothetical protein
MKRNFNNYIVWEESGNDKLVVEPKKNLVNTEEIQAIFDTQITTELATGQTAVLGSASVQISTEVQQSFRNRSITIFLDVAGSPPYKLVRNNEVLETELQESDFPYIDQRAVTQSFVSPAQATGREEEVTIFYEIESNRENVDTAEVTVKL